MKPLETAGRRWGEDVYTQTVQSVREDSGDGQDGPLPLPPPLLLVLQLACGFSEEHHVLFALDLPLEELQRGAVKAHHVLRHAESRSDEEMSEGDDHVGQDDKETFLVTKPLLQMLLTLISHTFKRVLVRSSSMTDSSIWLLEIWPKWILERKRQQRQLSLVLHTAKHLQLTCADLRLQLDLLYQLWKCVRQTRD